MIDATSPPPADSSAKPRSARPVGVSSASCWSSVGQVAGRDERAAQQGEHERHGRRQRVGRLLGAGHAGDEAGDAGDDQRRGRDQQHDADRVAPVGAERQRR